MQHVLVTGGAGYIGSVLVGILLNKGYSVTVLDNMNFGGEALLNFWHHGGFRIIRSDITNSEKIESIFQNLRFDAVVHLAAIVGDPACARQPDLAEKVNWNASLHILECSIKNDLRRFVFASTCSNYGKMEDPESYLDETSPLAPISLYAELKVKFEKVILSELEKRERFCPTCLRFSTVYGLSPRMRFDLTVNEFSRELALGRKLDVFGEQFWRPYCHVYDIAKAVELVLTSEPGKVAYNVFNIGDTKENYTKAMIVKEIKKFIPDATVNHVRRDEDPRDYRVSFEKIKAELGFAITKTVPDGIEETISAIKDRVIKNPDDKKYQNI